MFSLAVSTFFSSQESLYKALNSSACKPKERGKPSMRSIHMTYRSKLRDISWWFEPDRVQGHIRIKCISCKILKTRNWDHRVFTIEALSLLLYYSIVCILAYSSSSARILARSSRGRRALVAYLLAYDELLNDEKMTDKFWANADTSAGLLIIPNSIRAWWREANLLWRYFNWGINFNEPKTHTASRESVAVCGVFALEAIVVSVISAEKHCQKPGPSCYDVFSVVYLPEQCSSENLEQRTCRVFFVRSSSIRLGTSISSLRWL